MDNLRFRPRRLRRNPAIRGLVRETRVSKSSLIYPLFVEEGTGIAAPIPSLDGQFRYSPDTLPRALEQVCEAGVPAVMLFGIPAQKDPEGTSAWAENGVVQQALREARARFPELYLITDVCLCEYTSHGHCGLLRGQEVDNDRTLEVLARTALSHVQAGADMVAPSDMMDGRVLAIRETLDRNGFSETPILSYAVKYASAFYGPFRDAAGSAPGFGDRKGYQMDYHNSREAVREALLDVEQGADILMVKPALAYLDVLAEVARATGMPMAAYSVSGEYAMIKAAAKAGLIDEASAACESAVSIFRAGADILISYYAKELAGWIDEGRIG
ncbi:porphobilinogen synthase [Anaerotruncus sp. 1XD42-93]|uniref:porphobilinogen synthase n=1 Tax=Anaerotruncus sp. 1XD42-93 TaxID=2320853 RepID=UPI000EA2E6A6|nr:porphobilinogen synthase [Anaerotruncus sp. 1XD42-93]NBK18398.1 porphobilinogen synthase [Anaerotruncus sp. 1XD42-93]RKJ81890.1 porphobilinogen synthase [Anaerotruncus sp. 1XD22-93]